MGPVQYIGPISGYICFCVICPLYHHHDIDAGTETGIPVSIEIITMTCLFLWCVRKTGLSGREKQMLDTEAVACGILDSIGAAPCIDLPYRHWLVEDLFDADVIAAIDKVPFPKPDALEISGSREVNNASRLYFDQDNQAKYEICASIANALQDKAVTDGISKLYGIDLSGTYLRIEYAQDGEGFWLEPHTDIGVKTFTMLVYLSEEQEVGLGTDIFSDPSTMVARTPFGPGKALVFIPSNNTYHGFTKRPIEGLRKSIIINYVTDDWRAREQLAFPDRPIA